MPEEPNGNTDQPSGRHRPDQPLQDRADDKLGWYNFAQSVARSIVETPHREAMVYGIRGPWGSGKTTVLNFIRKELGLTGNRSNNQNDRASFTVIDFNPWWFSGSGDILGQLLTALARGIGQKNREAAKLLGKYLPLVRPITKAIPLADAAVEVTERMANLLSDPDPHELKKKITAELAMKAGGNRYVMFIDDLDRLQPPELLQVFQAIKAVADFPAMTYVLAYDNAVAAEAITQAGYRDPESYLRKIVQVPIDLPPVSPLLLQRYFEDVVVKPLQNDRWNQADWEQYGLPYVRESIRTPRDVIRVYNAVVPRYFGVKDSVDPLQYLILHWVRCQHPQLDTWFLDRGIPSLVNEAPVLIETLQRAMGTYPALLGPIQGALSVLFSRLMPDRQPYKTCWTMDNANSFTYLYSCEPPMEELRNEVSRLLRDNPGEVLANLDRHRARDRSRLRQTVLLIAHPDWVESLSGAQREAIALALAANPQIEEMLFTEHLRSPENQVNSQRLANPPKLASVIAHLLVNPDERDRVGALLTEKSASLALAVDSVWESDPERQSTPEALPRFRDALFKRVIDTPIEELLRIPPGKTGLILEVMHCLDPQRYQEVITGRLDTDDLLFLWYASASTRYKPAQPELFSIEGIQKIRHRLDRMDLERHADKIKTLRERFAIQPRYATWDRWPPPSDPVVRV